MKDSTLHCECLLWSAEMLIKEERKIEAKAKLKQILQKATVGSKLERKAQQMMKILDDGHHSDSTTRHSKQQIHFILTSSSSE